ncbi:MAG: hypothetical protein JKY15_07140 [Deltaproteobacteria bacterium]|nr:hypothetical protein [Deltaproteobacteria bacterium]
MKIGFLAIFLLAAPVSAMYTTAAGSAGSADNLAGSLSPRGGSQPPSRAILWAGYTGAGIIAGCFLGGIAEYVYFESGRVLLLTATALASALFSHVAKELKDQPCISIVSQTAAKLVLIILPFKELASQTSDDLSPFFSRWVKLTKPNRDCRDLEEKVKSALITGNQTIIASRIDYFKGLAAQAKIKDRLDEIKINIGSCSMRPWCTAASQNVPVITKLSEDFLKLYPGYTDQNNTFPAAPWAQFLPTGESFIYSDKDVIQTAMSYNLDKLLDKETCDKLDFWLSAQKDNPEKVKYFKHFWNVLGINRFSESNSSTNGDL